jgi:hypothetical protein
MFFRFRTLAVPSLLFAAACVGDSSSDPSQDPPADPGQGQTVTPTDQKATGLGLAIMSSDASGAPRLVRSVVPRAAGAGMTPVAAARDHVAALKELYISQGQTTMDLVDRGDWLRRSMVFQSTAARSASSCTPMARLPRCLERCSLRP